MDFVVFSDDWGGHPSSCQHLFRQIAREHRVLWVNTVGMRAPGLTVEDLRKAVRKVGRMAGAVHATPTAGADTPQHLDVLQPPMVPFPGSSAARAFNDWSAVRAIRARMRARGFRDPVVVSTVPNACDVVHRLGAQAVVYYCVDDFGQWPGLDHDVVRSMERRLVERSDLIVATSDALMAAHVRSGRPTILLTHGVDLDRFLAPVLGQHTAVAQMPRPRAGFIGLVDERLDAELVAALADRLGHWQFVFVGPRAFDPAGLRSRPNVRFVDPVPYAEVPQAARSMDVLVLPYRVDAFTRTLAPLKLLEYLATGRPVVSVPLPEAAKRAPAVRLASNVDEWVEALSEFEASVPEADVRQRELATVLHAESWPQKADTLLALIARACASTPRAALR